MRNKTLADEPVRRAAPCSDVQHRVVLVASGQRGGAEKRRRRIRFMTSCQAAVIGHDVIRRPRWSADRWRVVRTWKLLLAEQIDRPMNKFVLFIGLYHSASENSSSKMTIFRMLNYLETELWVRYKLYLHLILLVIVHWPRWRVYDGISGLE